jgi:undecaprenyl diphosphate synthase
MPTPQHIAFLMDGNGRWGTAKGMGRLFGHKQGVEAMQRVTGMLLKAGIPYATVYGFSAENWQRPAEEVTGLMGLLRWYATEKLDELHAQNIRLRVIGERERLAPDIQTLLARAEEKTAHNTALTLQVALSYGARQEIVRAVNQALASGATAISEEILEHYLYTASIPDPDLIIRTAGEKRLSNFLLWQASYSELVFTDTLWPDFSETDFAAALAEYKGRKRRFGRV